MSEIGNYSEVDNNEILQSSDLETSLNSPVFQNLYDNSPIASWIFSSNSLKILYANNKALKLLNIDLDTLLQMTVQDLHLSVNESNCLQFLDFFNLVRMDNQRKYGVFEYTNCQNEIQLFDLYGQNIIYNQQECILIYCYDATILKQKERTLGLMKNIITNSRDAIIINSAYPITKQGTKITFANDAFYELTGYHEDEIIGNYPSLVRGYKLSFSQWRILKNSILEKTSCSIEVKFSINNYKEKWIRLRINPVFDDFGEHTHWVSILKDITESKYQSKNQIIYDEIHSLFHQGKGIKETLFLCLKTIIENHHFFKGDLWFLEREKNKLYCYDSYRFLYESGIDSIKSGEVFDFSLKMDLPGRVYNSKKVETMIIPADHPDSSPSAIAVGMPIVVDSNFLGVAIFYCNNSKSEKITRIQFLERIIDRISEELKKKLVGEELESLFHEGPDAICVTDIEGRIVKYNKSYLRLLSLSENSLESKETFFDFVHNEDRNQYKYLVNKCLQSNQNFNNEALRLSDSGFNTVWVSLSGSIFFNIQGRFIIFHIRDITKQIDLQSLLDNATQIANIGGWQYNLETDQFSLTDITKSILGLHPEQKMDFESILSFYKEEYRERVRSIVNRSIESGTPFSFDYPIITANGKEIWIRNIGSCEFYNNRCIKLHGSFQNIQKFKTDEISLLKLNKELKRKTQELTRSNSELEQFAYIASHDLQEPLRMVTSFLNQLEKKYNSILDEKGKKYIYFAVDGAKRMRKIILDLLEYSRIGRVHLKNEPLDLGAMVEEIKYLLNSSIEENRASIEISGNLIFNGPKLPLTQVFMNLIGNAIKFRKEDVTPIVKISHQKFNRFYQFSVEDNGIGIDPDNFNNIFTIFQRLHERDKYEGTGIGLTIAKKIIENLGGKIWVESNPGEGTIFHFTYIKVN